MVTADLAEPNSAKGLSLHEYINQMDKSFQEMLFELIDRSGMTDVECYKRANVDKRTATEITSSQGEQALTVIDFQAMWEKAVQQVLSLCAVLGKLYGLPEIKDTVYRIG